MKEWCTVIFVKEGVKALVVTRILPPADLFYLLSFPRYGSLKMTKGSKPNFHPCHLTSPGTTLHFVDMRILPPADFFYPGPSLYPRNISEIPDMIEISKISEIEILVKAWLVVDNVPLHR